MSFRAKLLEHLTALPVTEVKKLVSKYNKELDIRPISKLKKAEILAKISAKKPMDKQLLAKLTNEARATREGKKAQKASEKEAAKKPVEKFGTEKKKIKVKKSKAKPDFLDLDKDGNKKEPMKKAAKEAKKPKKSGPKAMSKEDAKAFNAAFAAAPEEEKGSLFPEKPKKKQGKGESATTKTTNTIIENWGKAVNNVELEQTEKKLTDTIRSQLEKKGSLNIDGLFSSNAKLANDLFAKYPPQKVLDGYKKYVEYLDDEGDKEIGQDKVTDYFTVSDGRLQPTLKTKALSQASLGKLEKANEFKLSKAKTAEPKTSRPKGDPLKKLVSMARDHKKNGIGAEGVRAYKKLVDEFLKTKPPQKEEALAKTLYNFIVNNVLRQKKRTVPNLNKLLKELGFKEM